VVAVGLVAGGPVVGGPGRAVVVVVAPPGGPLVEVVGPEAGDDGPVCVGVVPAPPGPVGVDGGRTDGPVPPVDRPPRPTVVRSGAGNVLACGPSGGGGCAAVGGNTVPKPGSDTRGTHGNRAKLAPRSVR
jgi:hypothetical protein